ncbi:hypothetical protein PYW08_014114 [Mythimna loreyi]|uniref:Uncharacterized protein n=1 Tax=Mythimna loreyi TaxID=667449 RepID=A0ACC2R6G7_9NEOP|nr:hypothetical protein PYW08_014114 [Mythimna loreyi]
MCTNATLSKRPKRSEHNIVVEEASDDGKQWDTKEQYYRISEPVNESDMKRDLFDKPENNVISHHSHHRATNVDHKKETTEFSDTKPLQDEIAKLDERNRPKKLRPFRIAHTKEKESKVGRKKNTSKNKTSSLKTKEHKSHSSTSKRLYGNDKNGDDDDNIENEVNDDVNVLMNNNAAQATTQKKVDANKTPERDFAVYEIGHPELWYTVHVQLFEKLSTADGKTVWNDLTKGEQASVSSKQPEWMGQDMNVRYRPAEWIPREEFALPSSSLCLLAPLRDEDSAGYSDNVTNLSGISDDGGYIVVPEEDVMGMKDEEEFINKRNDNNTDSEFSPKTEERNEQGRRRVVVRTSRALLTGNENKVNIALLGSDKYLTLPHRRPHHAQIDLEARADENELVRVGASGRIAIAVADSTRRTRTILTLQVGNTGLAAARFRVKTRDCGPALTELLNEDNKLLMTAGPVLIPPRHTRSLRLELPLEIPVDMAHCSVALVNDEEKSIAVREVAIKKGDRCFCVWHCDCVCLSEDPRLLCREMAESRQAAAGLCSRDRTRHARSACYKDVVYINIFVIVTGVILALLALGFIKAVVGLLFPRISSWGLDQMIQVPRKLDAYLEPQLKCRKVEYDNAGWPIHPDTRRRTVRMYSRSMEFALNVIFFVTVPCMIVYDAVKHLCIRFQKRKTDESSPLAKNNIKKCFSTQDMQAVAMRWRRRHGGLRKWMTPEAQELSKELWEKGLLPSTSVQCEFMRPLLREGRHAEPHGPDPADRDARDSCADSEQDDTDYVITQMQKSRESLSILKQKSKP